ncbi:Pentatricopeptide repeat domain-containing protein 3, mitochondrial [Larimichthys crocea]|uniref:Uncharacterized protein n=1 Tax=Larimichthys crocea TaxID=215358 RepID=A0ACD3REX1_LARCR|nr:Pentatricopeptide repeat domain-containing protein 3, mitochondrial [Larimichthys crocea]
MAAPGRHVGRFIHRNGRLLLNNLQQTRSHRSFGWTAALRQQAAEADKESTETIVIPRKKTWSKEAVLEALAATVSRDPTAYPYQFQDDSYLAPRTSLEFKLFSLSQESGRSAAKYFVNSNPKFFTKDFAEPHIPEGSGADHKKRKWRVRRASDLLKVTWKENNNAERIFNLLPEKDTRCYSALIRGMVMHGAYAKAFSVYTDMLNNRLAADVHIFNALISAAPDVREKYNERWDVITELLNQMSQQKVQPNLLTFNSVLKALRRCGALGRQQARQTLNEMKALGIAPSLATFNHLLAVFFKAGSVGKSNVDILQEVMTELAGASFTCQDPDDALFFSSAMRICLDHKDLHLSYKVQSLVEVDENWRLLGDSFQQSIYYGRFFNLLCMMEHIDVVLKWYRRLIPSLYYPNSQGLRDLLQALDTDSRLDLLPTIWKDIRTLGHDNKADLVEEVLNLMARETHSPEGHAAALQIKEQSSYRGAVRGLPVRVSQQRLSPESSGAGPAFRSLLSLRNAEAGNASAGRV